MVDTNEMISQTEDVRNGQEVSLDTCTGGGFMVGLYLRSKSEFTYKTFDDLDAAMEVYIRFVTAIVKGEGSYEKRRSWLKKRQGALLQHRKARWTWHVPRDGEGAGHIQF